MISTDASQIEITDALNGIFVLKFSPAETESIAGTWPFDIQIMDTSDNVVTLASGTIQFGANITKTYE